MRPERKNIHVGARAGEIIAKKQTDASNVRNVLFEPGALMAVADYRDSKVRDTRFQKSLRNVAEYADTFFRRQASDIADV